MWSKRLSWTSKKLTFKLSVSAWCKPCVLAPVVQTICWRTVTLCNDRKMKMERTLSLSPIEPELVVSCRTLLYCSANIEQGPSALKQVRCTPLPRSILVRFHVFHIILLTSTVTGELRNTETIVSWEVGSQNRCVTRSCPYLLPSPSTNPLLSLLLPFILHSPPLLVPLFFYLSSEYCTVQVQKTCL